MIQLPNNKKCYNLTEQVAQNLLNIQYLAEQYKNIDELPSIWADYKTAFDADLHTFEDWTTTFEGWENTLATYLANMSSAAVGAIAGQDIAPKTVSQTQANYELELEGLSTDFTPIYMRAQIINNVIRFVMNGYETNNSGSSKTIYSYLQANVTLPREISSKIYDFNGMTVAESDEKVTIAIGDAYISKSPYAAGENYQQIERVLLKFYNRGTTDLASLLVQRADGSGIVLADGESLYITGRIELTLI